MSYGGRRIWESLDLTVARGEFLAVLGPNGAGKTTLLKVVLGLERPSSGRVEIEGRPPRRGSGRIGYIPQQRAFDRDLPVRGRDLVRFGLDGHRPGVLTGGRETRRRVDEVIAAVGAAAFAAAPVGRLSGGEQQRLRIAQALLGDPAILLCDEPLLSLDVAQQRVITGLLDERRRRSGTTVVFVTHDINPVLPYVDRVLYLVGGRFAVGRPDEILTRERLSGLYGTEVGVVRLGGRLVVLTPEDDDLRRRAPRTRVPRAAAVGGAMTIGQYLGQPFAQHALLAAALVALACGLIGPFVITRGMAFAVHGTSELAFTGAAAGLLVANNAVAGALVGAVVVGGLIGALGVRERERDSSIGVILAAGMGLGVLLLSFYHGFASEATNILFGNIFGVSSRQLLLLGAIAVAVAVAMIAIYRPLLFASVDPEVAVARGVRVRLLGIVFLFVLAFTVTEAAQVVGTLLVLSLAITPAAAAHRLANSPLVVAVLSIVFALAAADGGLLISLESTTVKPSVFIVAISFAIYVVARLVGRWTRAAAGRAAGAAAGRMAA